VLEGGYGKTPRGSSAAKAEPLNMKTRQKKSSTAAIGNSAVAAATAASVEGGSKGAYVEEKVVGGLDRSQFSESAVAHLRALIDRKLPKN
jgi:hypothetical protein